MLLKDQGDLAGAEPLCREALQGFRETLGNRHPRTLVLLNHLGVMLQAQGEVVEALALLLELHSAWGTQSPRNLLDAIHELEARVQLEGLKARLSGLSGSGGGGIVGAWRKGMRVQLEGLKARPELNGCIGVLIGGVEESGRVPVKLLASTGMHAGVLLRVKPANLRGTA